MSRKQQVDNSQRTVQDKIDYYSQRVNNAKLTEGERRHARKRLTELCAGSSSKSQPPKTAPRKAAVPATVQQNNARNAGIGYGAAKAGVRVPVAPENKDAFRDGVKVGRALANK